MFREGIVTFDLRPPTSSATFEEISCRAFLRYRGYEHGPERRMDDNIPRLASIGGRTVASGPRHQPSEFCDVCDVCDGSLMQTCIKKCATAAKERERVGCWSRLLTTSSSSSRQPTEESATHTHTGGFRQNKSYPLCFMDYKSHLNST